MADDKVKFRLKGKGLYLTYPQNDTTKEEVLERAKELWKDNLNEYVIAIEDHKDGNPHLHCYFKLENEINYKNFKKLDWLGGKHGNYQIQRSPKHVLSYCIKDGDYIANFDVPAKLQAMKGKKKYVGEAILTGKRKLTDLVNEDASLLYDIEHWNRAINTYHFLSQPKRNHPMEVHIWWGDSGTGKSRQARETYPDAFWKNKGQWWDGYKNEETVIIDEFYGWLDYDFILRLCDRYPLTVPIKGGHAQFNSKRIIFTSNQRWEDWWTRPHDLEPFRRRITEVKHFTKEDDDA